MNCQPFIQIHLSFVCSILRKEYDLYKPSRKSVSKTFRIPFVGKLSFGQRKSLRYTQLNENQPQNANYKPFNPFALSLTSGKDTLTLVLKIAEHKNRSFSSTQEQNHHKYRNRNLIEKKTNNVVCFSTEE